MDCSFWIETYYWIVPAIGKHVVAQDALSSRNEYISIDESTHLGIVVSGLEVIELGLRIIHISTIAERIQDTESGCERTIGTQYIAPSVISVGNNGIAIGAIYQGNNVTLQVLNVVIELGCCRTLGAVGYLNGIASRIKNKVQLRCLITVCGIEIVIR